MECEPSESDIFSLSQLKIANMEIVSEISNDLLHIRSDLFNNQQDLNLENLFSESHSFVDFIGLECKKFETVLTKSCEKLMTRLVNLQMSEAQIEGVKEQMVKSGVIRKDKISIFDFEALKQRQFDFFVKKLHSTYVDNAFGNLRVLLGNFVELTGDADGNNVSISNKSTKKVFWTQAQEGELLAQMQKNHPENLTNQQIMDFCDKHKRTRAAVTNKIQKLKKKYAEELTKQSQMIINNVINGSHVERGLEDRIQDILMLRGHKTYEEILDELNIASGETSNVEEVNHTLYDLLSKHKIDCKEQLFIGLKPGAARDNGSVILGKIVEMVDKSEKKEMSFHTIRGGLIESFKQLDPAKHKFDQDLQEFIAKSEIFVMKQKRVFYT